MTSRNFQAQKNHAEMYAKDLIEEDPSDLSSRADALGTFQVDPLASHRATKPTKKKNKSVNLHENDESLTSTSEEDEQITEPECSINITTKSLASSAKRGARYRSKSRQFNNTLKRQHRLTDIALSF